MELASTFIKPWLNAPPRGARGVAKIKRTRDVAWAAGARWVSASRRNAHGGSPRVTSASASPEPRGPSAHSVWKLRGARWGRGWVDWSQRGQTGREDWACQRQALGMSAQRSWTSAAPKTRGSNVVPCALVTQCVKTAQLSLCCLRLLPVEFVLCLPLWVGCLGGALFWCLSGSYFISYNACRTHSSFHLPLVIFEFCPRFWLILARKVIVWV